MKKYFFAGIYVSTILGISPAVHGQNPVEEQPEERENNAVRSGVIDDIVITAQRKQETLQTAPIAVSAVSGEQLRNAGVIKPQNLTAMVPSLQVSTGGTYPLYYLRGVGNFNANPLSESAVAVNYNDVYISRPTSTYGLFYDLERVEVLKGPQGTLYGRNATGGSINILPRQASLGEFTGDVSIEYGNYDSMRFDGAVNIPLSENTAVRIAGIVAEHDGFMNNGFSNQDDIGARVSFLYEPSADLSVSVSADYYDQGGKGAGAAILPDGVDGRVDVRSPEGRSYFMSQYVGMAGRNFNPLPDAGYVDNQFWGLSATINWEQDWGSLTFIPAYRGAELDFVSYVSGLEMTQREKDKQFSTELRIASNDDGPLSWLFGAYYFKDDIEVPFFSPNLQYNVSLLNYETDMESAAAFARLGYEITPELRVSAAARYTRESKSLTGSNFGQSRMCVDLPTFNTTREAVVTGPCPGAAPFASGTGSPTAALNPFDPTFPFVGLNEIYGDTAIFQTAGLIEMDEDLDENEVTWRVGVDWDVGEESMLYANFETGFKAGGFFFTADDDGSYKPEKIKALTIGSKNRFMDGRLQLNLEGFYWRYTDQQVSIIGSDSERNFILPTRNVGKAEFKGVEIETQYALTPYTRLKLDVQYLDAEYDTFSYQIPNQGPPTTGCQASGLFSPQITLDCSGKRPPNAPEWRVNLGAQHTIPLAGGAELVVDGRANYQSRTLAGLEFLPQQTQDSHWLVDAGLTFNSADDRLYVTGFINNAFDEEVISGAILVALSSFPVAQLNNPRTYGLRLGYRF